MPPVRLRQRVFNSWGMSRVRRVPKKYRGRYRGLSYFSQCDILVMGPPEKQLSGDHPHLIKRLVSDWGNRLSLLSCSTGNFRAALEGGEVNLTHVWAELYCLWLQEVAHQLGLGHIRFAEECQPFNITKEFTESQVIFFYSAPYPVQICGLEHKVTGYLNTLIEDRPYNLKRRLREFVRYRQEELSSIQSARPSRPQRPTRLRPFRAPLSRPRELERV